MGLSVQMNIDFVQNIPQVMPFLTHYPVAMMQLVKKKIKLNYDRSTKSFLTQCITKNS